MWRDIDSLRRQNALSRQQNEELRKENEAIERETEQIEQETEQIEQETAILRRQNKALAFLESRNFDKMVRELAGPGDCNARHPLDRVDVGLLCEKLVEHGCVEEDIPFLLNALELGNKQNGKRIAESSDALSRVYELSNTCERVLFSSSTPAHSVVFCNPVPGTSTITLREPNGRRILRQVVPPLKRAVLFPPLLKGGIIDFCFEDPSTEGIYTASWSTDNLPASFFEILIVPSPLTTLTQRKNI
jgi:hypothetical protein